MTEPADDFRMRRIAVAAYGPTLLASVGAGAIDPILPLLALDLGASPAVAGLVVTAGLLGSLASSLPGSVWTARVGERYALVAAGLTQAVLVALLLAASSPALVALDAFAIGATMTVFGLARQTYLTEAVPLRLRARALSTLGGVLRAGAFVGPLAGAALLSTTGRAWVIWLAVAFLGAAAALAASLPDLPGDRATTRPAGVRMAAVVGDHRRFFATLGTAIALLAAVRSTRSVALPLWGHHLGLTDAQVSFAVACSWGLDTLLFYPGGAIMDRYGRRAAALPTTLGMAVAFAVLPLAADFRGLVVAGLLIAVGNGFGSGIVMTISADHSPDVGRPQFLGAARFVTTLGSLAGPAVTSALTAVFSLAVGLAATSGLALVSAALFAVFLPRRPRA